MGYAILVVFALVVFGPFLLHHMALEERLRGRGVWFPILVWGAALGVMALSMKLKPGAGSAFGGIAFGALLVAPLAAALLTLTWRDARIEGRSAAESATPAHPHGLVAPPWVRVTSAILSMLSITTMMIVLAEHGWRELPPIVGTFAFTTYVALSGRVPRDLARRA